MQAGRASWLVIVVALAAGVTACGHEWSAAGDADDAESGADDGSHPPDSADVDADGAADTDGGCSAPRIDCGGTCVDPTADVDHCGECWWICDPANGTGACVAGTCSVTCDPGWIDANGTAVDGCE